MTNDLRERKEKKKFHFETHLRPVARVPLGQAFAQVTRSRVIGLIASGALHVKTNTVLPSHKCQTNDFSGLGSLIARSRTLSKKRKWRLLMIFTSIRRTNSTNWLCSADKEQLWNTWLQGPVNHLPLQSLAETHVLVVSGFLAESQSSWLLPEQWALRVWMPVPHSSEHCMIKIKGPLKSES